jgi:ABC-2 type transport system ATP-binding protein
MEIILKTNALSKNYSKIKALSNLSFEVRKGMVFGILGPNGSGKTTTLGIILGVINQNSGDYSWFGNGMNDENRTRIGALLETPNFYPYLTAVQNLQIVAKIKGIARHEEAIASVLVQVGLSERKDSEFRTYSLGMKQRLAIGAALLGEPEVLVLDEPTNGLDPEGIAEIRTLILDISKKGKTIIIASHQLDEIEKVCTDVLIMRKGIALKSSAINEITDKKRQILVSSDEIDRVVILLKSHPEISIAKSTNTELILDVPNDMSSKSINQLCFDHGIVLTGLREIQRSLEDQFLELIKA